MVSKLPTTTCTLVCLRVEHYTSWIGADFIWYLFIRINGANNSWNYCHDFFSWMTNMASIFYIPMLLTKLGHCHNTWFCLIRLILSFSASFASVPIAKALIDYPRWIHLHHTVSVVQPQGSSHVAYGRTDRRLAATQSPRSKLHKCRSWFHLHRFLLA